MNKNQKCQLTQNQKTKITNQGSGSIQQTNTLANKMTQSQDPETKQNKTNQTTQILLKVMPCTCHACQSCHAIHWCVFYCLLCKLFQLSQSDTFDKSKLFLREAHSTIDPGPIRKQIKQGKKTYGSEEILAFLQFLPFLPFVFFPSSHK